ncbi:MAG: outer membrane lipoprotein carrier protein LolA [Alphaproteobacteria bacterium]
MRHIFLIAALLALVSSPALAARSRVDDARSIVEAEDYINARRTIASKFIQTTDDGQTVTGTLLISRPGRMNLSYDTPLKDFIIADGSFIYMWDGELEQSTTIPLGGSLADLILRENLRLDGDVRVTNIKHGSKTVEITVAEAKNPDVGTMTLLFETEPFILHGWRVQDAQNRTTTIALQGMREGVDIPERSFRFIPPKLGKSTKTDKPINK